MKKRMVKSILCCALAAMMTAGDLPGGIVSFIRNYETVFAEGSLTYSTGNSKYTYEVLEDGSVEISYYNGTDAVVAIPEEIDGKRVTSIGEEAFFECSSITSIEIPKSVISIGKLALGRCNSVTNIYVDEENTSYFTQDGILFDRGKTELIKCPVSKSGKYTIPSGVTHIREFAFENCSSLTDIEIPDSVTDISEFAFYGCSRHGVMSMVMMKPISQMRC